MLKIKFFLRLILISALFCTGTKARVFGRVTLHEDDLEFLIQEKLADIKNSFDAQLAGVNEHEDGYVTLKTLLTDISSVEEKIPQKGIFDKAGKKIKSVGRKIIGGEKPQPTVDEKIQGAFEQFVSAISSQIKNHGGKIPNVKIKKEDLDALSFYLTEYFKLQAESSWQGYFSSAAYSIELLRYLLYPFYYLSYPVIQAVDFLIGIKLIKFVIRSVVLILVLKLAYTKIPFAHLAMDEMMIIAKGFIKHGVVFVIKTIKDVFLPHNVPAPAPSLDETNFISRIIDKIGDFGFRRVWRIFF